MTGSDRLAPRQIGNRSRQLQNTVIGSRAELQLAHGALHRPAQSFIQVAELAHLGRVHVCVAGEGVAGGQGGDAVSGKKNKKCPAERALDGLKSLDY
jgi:hypothetical protein